MRMEQRPGHVLVIGAGIIGLSVALRLHLDGCDVSVIDADEPMHGCSSGNAGCLSEANLFPPATADTLLQLPKLLLSKSGPLIIRPNYLPTMLPWLARAGTALRQDKHDGIVRAMAGLTRRAIDSFEALTSAADAGHLVTRKGLLVACRAEATLAVRARRIPAWEQSGIQVQKVSAALMTEMAPALRHDLSGGLYFPRSGRCSSPRNLGLAYARHLRAGGVAITRGRVLGLHDVARDRIHVHTTSGPLLADKVVLCTGHESKELLSSVGQTAPVARERGYHLMLPATTGGLDLPVIFGEPYFAATPMDEGLRLAGTAEFARADAPEEMGRAWLLLEQARDYLARVDPEGAAPWVGTRSSLPDGMPAIGRFGGSPNVVYAFGHGHNGLTLSAVTAECVSALITDQVPPVDLEPFSIQRFH